MKKILFLLLLLANSFTLSASSFSQAIYRWRNDNGSQTSATWKAASNTAITLNYSEKIRVRFAVSGNGYSGTANFNGLSYNKGTGWVTITTSTINDFSIVSSDFVTNNTNTTQQISSGNFAGGYFKSDTNTFSLDYESGYSEVEYCIKPNSTYDKSATYQFRINGLDTYNQYPTINPNANYCETPSPQVTSQVFYTVGDVATPLTATGTNLLWYTTATGGLASTTAPLPTTTAIGTTPYWVSQTLNGCEGPREKIDVIVTGPATHLKFDGIDDYIVTNNPINFANQTFSIDFWAKRESFTGYQYILSSGSMGPSNYFLAVLFRNDTNKISLSFWEDDLDSNASITDTNWHHYAFTYDATTKLQSIYIDGILDSTRVAYSDTYVNSMLYIGSNLGNQEFFSGNIDDLRIWNVARTPEQILNSKNCELQGNEAGLVAYYKFNQGIGYLNNTGLTTLTATTGSNGTLYNFALTGSSSNWLSGSPVTSGIMIPTPPTASVQTFCLGANPTVANLTATGSGGTIKWYNVSSGGTALSSTTALVTGTYYASEANANGCESARTAVNVTFYSIPSPTASAQTFIPNATVASLVANGQAGATFSWYNTNTGGTPLSLSTPLSTGVYYVSQTVNGCESYRIPVNVSSVFASAISSSFCGSTINNLYVTITATGVIGAQGYRFKVTNMNNNSVQIIDRPVNSLALSNVPGVMLATQYMIEVAVKLNGLWQTTYGLPCYVTTPSPQPTVGAQCGTTLSTMGEWVFVPAVPNVTYYRFRITNINDETVQIKDNPYNKFNFLQLPNRAYSTTYIVEVAVRNTNGEYLSYGLPCNITTPADPNSVVNDNRSNSVAKNSFEDFRTTLFPNPYSNFFTINLETHSDSIVIVKVYDMLGKLVDDKSISPSEISKLEIGSNYAPGVYNVVINQDDNIKVSRIVKR